MPLNAFQDMVVKTMERSLGPAGDTLTRRVCIEMGTPLETLGPQHMAEFSRRVFDATVGILEEYKRKFLAGTLAKFENSVVARAVRGV